MNGKYTAFYIDFEFLKQEQVTKIFLVEKKTCIFRQVHFCSITPHLYALLQKMQGTPVTNHVSMETINDTSIRGTQKPFLHPLERLPEIILYFGHNEKVQKELLKRYEEKNGETEQMIRAKPFTAWSEESPIVEGEWEYRTAPRNWS